MTSPILVVGHKNPDNDSICAAVGYAYLKNELAKREGSSTRYVAARLGALPPESAWVLDGFDVEPPIPISHVRARVSDVMTSDPIGIDQDATLVNAGRRLRKYNLRSLVVTDEEGKYRGLITTRMLAYRYISATDLLDRADNNMETVANDLLRSLDQRVSEITEVDVLTLSPDGLLSDAVEDLMTSSLREAVVLDEEGYCIGIVTRSDVATRPRRKLILVDHNETSQAANGIEEADVLEIIDHHRIADVTTSSPIQFINLPVGSTATIVTMEFRKYGVEIPQGIAAALLSAIMTDTVVLKSPTATPTDQDQAEYLAKIVGVDAVEFGLEVFQCHGGDGKAPVEKLVGADAKEFALGDQTILIAQHETVDLSHIMEREDEIRAYMRDMVASHNYEFVLLMITDILAEGSQFLVEGNRRIVNRAFNINCTGEGGVWMPGVLSRKKQVVSRILGA